MSYNTMEQMVLAAVKGTPATSKSRTDHFKRTRRLATPFPGPEIDSGSDLPGESSQSESDTGRATETDVKSGESTMHEETDSAGGNGSY